MTQFEFDSVSPNTVQNLINEMGGYGFNISHTAQENQFAIAGHGISGTASYDPTGQKLSVVIAEKQGLAKLISDATIHNQILHALGRA